MPQPESPSPSGNKTEDYALLITSIALFIAVLTYLSILNDALK
jgi:hypothetical protein